MELGSVCPDEEQLQQETNILAFMSAFLGFMMTVHYFYTKCKPSDDVHDNVQVQQQLLDQGYLFDDGIDFGNQGTYRRLNGFLETDSSQDSAINDCCSFWCCSQNQEPTSDTWVLGDSELPDPVDQL